MEDLEVIEGIQIRGEEATASSTDMLLRIAFREELKRLEAAGKWRRKKGFKVKGLRNLAKRLWE